MDPEEFDLRKVRTKTLIASVEASVLTIVIATAIEGLTIRVMDFAGSGISVARVTRVTASVIASGVHRGVMTV